MAYPCTHVGADVIICHHVVFGERRIGTVQLDHAGWPFVVTCDECFQVINELQDNKALRDAEMEKQCVGMCRACAAEINPTLGQQSDMRSIPKPAKPRLPA
jgi:hypothetical protein